MSGSGLVMVHGHSVVPASSSPASASRPLLRGDVSTCVVLFRRLATSGLISVVARCSFFFFFFFLLFFPESNSAVSPGPMVHADIQVRVL